MPAVALASAASPALQEAAKEAPGFGYRYLDEYAPHADANAAPASAESRTISSAPAPAALTDSTAAVPTAAALPPLLQPLPVRDLHVATPDSIPTGELIGPPPPHHTVADAWHERAKTILPEAVSGHHHAHHDTHIEDDACGGNHLHCAEHHYHPVAKEFPAGHVPAILRDHCEHPAYHQLLATLDAQTNPSGSKISAVWHVLRDGVIHALAERHFEADRQAAHECVAGDDCVSAEALPEAVRLYREELAAERALEKARRQVEEAEGRSHLALPVLYGDDMVLPLEYPKSPRHKLKPIPHSDDERRENISLASLLHRPIALQGTAVARADAVNSDLGALLRAVGGALTERRDEGERRESAPALVDLLSRLANEVGNERMYVYRYINSC
jgi:hypothetical protein